MEKEFMTTKEVQDYLRISKVTLLKMIHDKKIRAYKVSGTYRFKKHELDEDLMVNN